MSVLTTDQIHALESLLDTARRAEGAAADVIAAGDVVQLRPGASQTWESSLMLVEQHRDGKIRGQILRPNRGGCREAWATHTAPEVVRVGRAPFREPAPDIKAWCYAPPCGRLADPVDAASYRTDRAKMLAGIRAEQIELERQEASARRKQALRAHGKQRQKAG